MTDEDHARIAAAARRRARKQLLVGIVTMVTTFAAMLAGFSGSFGSASPAIAVGGLLSWFVGGVLTYASTQNWIAAVRVERELARRRQLPEARVVER